MKATKPRTTSVSARHAHQEVTGLGTYFQTRDARISEAKRHIAKYVVDHFLHEGDAILLDTGTSLCPIAEEIAKRAQVDPGGTHFTILTHNLRAFQILVEKTPRDANLNIVLAGGRYDQDLNGLFGPQTIMAYEHFFPRVVLIGISGLIAYQGLFCHGNTEELAVKEVIFNKPARDRIIVADHTKIGIPDALRFGRSTDFRARTEHCFLVTNKPSEGADLATRERFQKELQMLETHGINVMVVN
jgi:DeoR/GlpR family transcriptional regulator of sugar metabolism